MCSARMKFSGSIKRNLRGLKYALAAVFVFVCLVYAAERWFPEESLSGRAFVLDGDSLELNGRRLRLEGIDAPEGRQTCQHDGKAWPCGRQATAALRRLVAGRQVKCRELGRDRYDRLLAECHVGETDIAAEMVRQGWALSYRAGKYIEEEEQAKRAKAGIWSGKFLPPREWRREME